MHHLAVQTMSEMSHLIVDSVQFPVCPNKFTAAHMILTVVQTSNTN